MYSFFKPKIFIFYFLYTIFIIINTTLYGQDQNRMPINIILIGWDGAQREHIKESLKRDELPNLKKIIEQGSFVDIDVIGKTDTKAGWSEILTGYGPEKTGVYNNSVYQPIPEGWTIFERIRDKYGKTNVVTVAVIGKKGHVGGFEEPRKIFLKEEDLLYLEKLKNKKNSQGKNEINKNTLKKNNDNSEVLKSDKTKNKKNIVSKAKMKLLRMIVNSELISKKADQSNQGAKIIEEYGKKYLFVPGEPYYYTHNNVDEWHNGLSLDEKVGTMALEFLNKYKEKPFFFFVHFAEVDHSGHKYGENSKEYNNALISNDYWTGKIIEKLKELNLYNKTLIYVTADHGFDEDKTSHSNAPTVFLATIDKEVKQNGNRADVGATILKKAGINLISLNPKLDGNPLF